MRKSTLYAARHISLFALGLLFIVHSGLRLISEDTSWSALAEGALGVFLIEVMIAVGKAERGERA